MRSLVLYNKIYNYPIISAFFTIVIYKYILFSNASFLIYTILLLFVVERFSILKKIKFIIKKLKTITQKYKNNNLDSINIIDTDTYGNKIGTFSFISNKQKFIVKAINKKKQLILKVYLCGIGDTVEVYSKDGLQTIEIYRESILKLLNELNPLFKAK